MQGGPRRPRAHQIGERAEVLVRAVLPQSWTVRKLEHDYGADLEIEIFDGEESTGILIKAQVKGHDLVDWRRDGRRTERLEPSTITYLRNLPVPCILFVAETATDHVWWAPVRAEEEPSSSGLEVSRGHRLPNDLDGLLRFVHSWRSKAANDEIIRSVISWGPALVARVGEDCDGDFFLPLSYEEQRTVRFLYGRLRMLRVALGLREPEMVPWDLWVARSELQNPDERGVLFHAELNQMRPYLRGLYREAIDVIRQRLPKVPSDQDNADFWSFIDPAFGVRRILVDVNDAVRDPKISSWIDAQIAAYENEPPLVNGSE